MMGAGARLRDDLKPDLQGFLVWLRRQVLALCGATGKVGGELHEGSGSGVIYKKVERPGEVNQVWGGGRGFWVSS